MEPEPPLETRPPALVSAIVRALIPPACHEAVIGDLWERYTTPRALLREALRSLPFLLLTRIRRTTNALMLSLAFLMLFASFGGAPTHWLRAAIPATFVLAAFVLRDVYHLDSTSPTRRAVGDAVAAAASAVVSQAVVAAVRPDLLLGRWSLATGALACLAIVAGRSAGPRPDSRQALASGTSMSLDELRHEMRQVEHAARRTRLVETLAGILVIAAGFAGAWLAPEPVGKAGYALMAAGAAFVVVYLHRHALRPLPMDLGFEASRAALRGALHRGERMLRTIWLWYLLPLMVGPIVLIAGTALKRGLPPTTMLGFLGTTVLLSVLVARLNQHMARTLARRIATLDETDERH